MPKHLTNAQMLHAAEKNSANMNLLFLRFVEDGMTRQELQKNIDRRPALWGRWANWLDKLPEEASPDA